jgi:transketolase
MVFDLKKIKNLSIIGQRATLGTCLFEIEENYENLLVLSADTSTSAGLDKFRKIKPHKYIEMGISEQNMIGVAAGLSSENFNVLTTTFSPFQTLRCLEQIKVNLGYMKFKVTMVGLASGVALGTLGYTHCSIEDLSIIYSIPNIKIISPADSLETYKSVMASLDSKDSTYIRLTGNAPSNIVYNEDYKFEIGKAKIITSYGIDACIISCGSMVYHSKKASKILLEKNIKTSVYNFHTIRPLDKNILENIFEKFNLIITVEEHNVVNGLGSVIANEIVSFKKKIRLKKLGLPHNYEKSGEYGDLLNFYNLNSKGIAEEVAQLINNE